MSESKENPPTPGKPGEAKPEGEKGMHKVDEAAQEQAAEEREESGGYD